MLNTAESAVTVLVIPCPPGGHTRRRGRPAETKYSGRLFFILIIHKAVL
jgi:hypothetical protein